MCAPGGAPVRRRAGRHARPTCSLCIWISSAYTSSSWVPFLGSSVPSSPMHDLAPAVLSPQDATLSTDHYMRTRSPDELVASDGSLQP